MRQTKRSPVMATSIPEPEEPQSPQSKKPSMGLLNIKHRLSDRVARVRTRGNSTPPLHVHPPRPQNTTRRDTNHPVESSPNVRARFHSLFPLSDPSNSLNPRELPIPLLGSKIHDEPASSLAQKYLKVRIVSWNMHDSLPKGDLETLLGAIPTYTPQSADDGQIPDFGDSPDHPYHIVIVAGQECPSVSGLPMAFGAGYNSSAARDKDKEKRAHKKKKYEDERNPGSSPNIESSPLLPGESMSPMTGNFPSTGNLSTGTTLPVSSTPHPGGWSSVLEDWFVRGIKSTASSVNEVQSADSDSHVSSTLTSSQTSAHAPSLNRALSDSAIHRPAHSIHLLTDASRDAGLHDSAHGRSKAGLYLSPVSLRPDDPSGLHPASPKSPTFRHGSYELAVKERMMGIYLAAYVHRDVKSLVQGTDKGAVAAGLIGGRVGNKGGVGVSMNVAGTTFLFINAHLAAHEGRANLRMANLSKIKSELSLDAFLAPDDPRMFAEDITDRFDHTFIFGDLNFRLDVSRLHADWLISRKEYAQALEFDQLRVRMKKGEFPGFREGPINFAPTFKYDVQRGRHHRQLSVRKAIQRTRHHLEKDIRLRKRGSGESDVHSFDLAGDETLWPDEIVMSIEEEEQDAEAEEAEPDGDRQSVSSTIWGSSLFSKYATDAEDDESSEAETAPISPAAQNAALNSRSPRRALQQSMSKSDAIQKIIHHPATQKAKAKLLSLVASRSRSSATDGRSENSREVAPNGGKSVPDSGLSPKSSTQRHETPRRLSVSPRKALSLNHNTNSVPPPSIEVFEPAENTPPPLVELVTSENDLQASTSRPSVERSSSQTSNTAKRGPKNHGRDGHSGEVGVAPKSGVYDSSSKQRVPSWCDRIIFKSAVIKEPDVIDVDSSDQARGSRSHRVGQFLTHTLWHRASRPRQDSLLSLESSTESHQSTPAPARQSSFRTLGPAESSDNDLLSPMMPKEFPFVTSSPDLSSNTSPSIPSRTSSVNLLNGSDNHSTPTPHQHTLNAPLPPDRLRKRSFSASALPSFNSPPVSSTSAQPVTVTHSSSLPPPPSKSRRARPSGVEASPATPNEASSSHPYNALTPAKRWFMQFPNSLFPSSAPLHTAPEVPQPVLHADPSTKPTRRKGDVECLSYNTLDDREMARLQGRSDHRPIVGVYSVCIS